MDTQLYDTIVKTIIELNEGLFPQDQNILNHWSGYKQALSDVLNYMEKKETDPNAQLGKWSHID